MVRVQPNHGRGGRAAAKAFGMPHAEVSVRSLKSEWPFPIGCSILPTAYCWKDCGLCCYAVSCPLCAHAELAVQNDIKGFCGAESMMMQIQAPENCRSLLQSTMMLQTSPSRPTMLLKIVVPVLDFCDVF